jgi:hypothetical protein
MMNALLKKFILIHYSAVVSGVKRAPPNWADKIASVFNIYIYSIASGFLIKLDLYIFGLRSDTIWKYSPVLYILPLGYLIFEKIGVKGKRIFPFRPDKGYKKNIYKEIINSIIVILLAMFSVVLLIFILWI